MQRKIKSRYPPTEPVFLYIVVL